MTILNKKCNFKWFPIVSLAFPLCKLLVGREQAGAGGFEEGPQHPTKHSSRKWVERIKLRTTLNGGLIR